MNDEDKQTVADFREAVNMARKELEAWLETDDSQAVGYKDDDEAESVGHASGRRIVQLLHIKQADYTDEDVKHMRKVVGYVRRHLAQHPGGDISATPWRYSLMN